MFAQYRLIDIDLVNGLTHASAFIFMLGSGVYSHVNQSRGLVMLLYFLYVWCLIISRTMKVYCLHRMTVKPLMEKKKKFNLARNLISAVYAFSLFTAFSNSIVFRFLG